MGHQIFLKSAFLLGMAASIVGCKSSAPRAPQQASSSPTPAATATPTAKPVTVPVQTTPPVVSDDPAVDPGDDPAVAPGIKREQFSVDLGPFGQESQLMVIPSVDSRGDEGETWPTHLGIEKHDFEFRIIPIAGYEKFFPKSKELAGLKAALSANGSKVKVEGFPYSREDHWDGYVTSLRRETIAGEGWRGVRWIGGFGGDEDYPSGGLGYVFNGISDDGRYLIVLRADLSHADHKRFMPPRKTMGTPGRTWETSDPKVQTEMRQRLEKSLNTADPASFTPNLNDLDAVIRSLKLKP
jgi:hypothetical protein